jgi:hypothetical protein
MILLWLLGAYESHPLLLSCQPEAYLPKGFNIVNFSVSSIFFAKIFKLRNVSCKKILS